MGDIVSQFHQRFHQDRMELREISGCWLARNSNRQNGDDRAVLLVIMRQVIDLIGAPCRTRTCDLLVRSQTLYPTELKAH
jgi:hypothetical protein